MPHLPSGARRLCLAAALSGLAIPAGLAQTAPRPVEGGPAHRLDEVTITAEPLDTSGLLTPAQQLSGAALTQRLGSTLGETLDQLPGVANSSFGPNVGRPTIRGLDGDRIQILQNGTAVQDASSLSFDHAVPIDPLTTERIEVLRGPATLQYGGSALGGVVNVIDNRIARQRNFDANGGVLGKAEVRVGGAAQERSTGMMVESGNDRIAVHADAFERRTGDLRVPRDMPCGTGVGRRVCNSDSHTRGGGVGLTVYGDRSYLGWSSSEYRSDYGTVAEEGVRIGMVRRHHVLEGAWRDLLPGFDQVRVQLGQTDYRHTEYDAGVAGTVFSNQGHALRVQANQPSRALGEGVQWSGLLGVQHDASDFQALGAEAFVPSSRSRSAALYAIQTLRTGWGEWRGGWRQESVSVRSLGGDAFGAGESRQFQPTSVALGFVRALASATPEQGWQISGNLTRSQRAPRDYELFANGEHVATHAYEVGDATLGLERALQMDLGAAWRQGPHRAGVTLFQSNFDNYLALRPDGTQQNGLDVYRFEGVRARLQGWEAQARWRLVGGRQALTRLDPHWGAVDLELRADGVQAQDLTHDQPLPRIAPLRVGGDLLWSREGWGARLGLTHAMAQNRVPEGQRSTPGHTLWSLGLNHHTHRGRLHWLWFARLDNLTNQTAYAATSILRQTLAAERVPPLPGRSLRLGLQLSF